MPDINTHRLCINNYKSLVLNTWKKCKIGYYTSRVGHDPSYLLEGESIIMLLCVIGPKKASVPQAPDDAAGIVFNSSDYTSGAPRKSGGD